jgi:hypothetical protein|tara:strand:- start:51 stop:185 length:135 start_codon:yes stop_codon:yes gene_type:complete
MAPVRVCQSIAGQDIISKTDRLVKLCGHANPLQGRTSLQNLTAL